MFKVRKFLGRLHGRMDPPLALAYGLQPGCLTYLAPAATYGFFLHDVSRWDSKHGSCVWHRHVLFDDRPSRYQIGVAICRNRNHGFFPHVRRRADGDMGRLGPDKSARYPKVVVDMGKLRRYSNING